MIDPNLRRHLDPVLRRVRNARFLRRLAVLWLALAGAALVSTGIEAVSGISLNALVPIFLLAGVFGLVYLALVTQMWTPDLREIARRVEQANPELNSLLLTAVEQKPDPATGQFSFLQLRLIREAVTAAMHHDWSRSVTTRSLNLWRMTQLGAFGVAAISIWILYLNKPYALGPSRIAALVRGIEVTPGDVRLEKGSSLVVLVKFNGSVPPEATLVYQTGANTRRVGLSRNLSDPVFGGTIPEVKEDAVYRIEYRGKTTGDFKVRTYEHPRLNRADADIVYPAYTRLGEKQVPDTRRVSAVEGSAVSFEMLLNKPVRTAQLVGRDGSIVALAAATNRAAATLASFPLVQSQTYELQLVDLEGLTNKVPTQFVLEALPNRPPQTKWLSPKGDQRPSALQEITYSAESQDDFGLLGYGFTFDLPDGTRREVRLAGTNAIPTKATDVMALPVVAGVNEKRSFSTPLSLETLGAEPGDLLSWYVWAEDIGPDGLVRRTDGDLFFGEVRPFEEIFRQAPPQDAQQQQQQQQQNGSPASRLAELQKQIINATWKLIREEAGGTPSKGYATNAELVLASQRQARTQADEVPVPQNDAAKARLAETVKTQMDLAIEHLDKARSSTGPLSEALKAERKAYEALIKLTPKETQVTQGQGGGGGGGGGRSQEQLDQLELSKSENRYETRSQAQEQRTAEQQEQMDLLSRLKELAERQQDLNDRLQEMQNALAAAQTEEAKEEARRQLKRLEDEQRQLLAEADSARQQTERSEQAEKFNEERRQLEQTREEMQKASEALEQGEVSRALSAGARAERQLAETRDELRRRSSGEFVEEMRQMRGEARDLAENQQKLTDELTKQDEGRRSLSDGPDRAKLLESLERQRSGLTNLVQQMRDVTRDAEATEPLLAKGLYETLRQHRVSEVENEFESARRLVDLTLNKEAGQLTEKTGRSIDSLRDGIERAAESVLGDEADSLRLAQAEIDDLAETLRRELAAQGRGTNELASAGGQQRGQSGQRRQGQGDQSRPPDQSGSGQQGEQGQQSGEQGQPGQRGQTAQNGQGQQPGQSGENGQQGQQGRDGQGGQQGEQGQGGQQGREGSGQQASAGQGQQPGQGKGQGDGQGQGNQPGQGQSPSEQAGQNGQGGRGRRQLADGNQNRNQGGGGGGGADSRNLRNGGGDLGTGGGTGPITGDGYRDWTRRLSDVEEMVGEPDLREEVARIRDRVRGFRSDFRNGDQKPHWDLVSDTVLKPLLEVRARVAEELAKKQSREAVVPIDRDPVPVRYSEAVRKYYERLGQED